MDTFFPYTTPCRSIRVSSAIDARHRKARRRRCKLTMHRRKGAPRLHKLRFNIIHFLASGVHTLTDGTRARKLPQILLFKVQTLLFSRAELFFALGQLSVEKF